MLKRDLIGSVSSETTCRHINCINISFPPHINWRMAAQDDALVHHEEDDEEEVKQGGVKEDDRANEEEEDQEDEKDKKEEVEQEVEEELTPVRRHQFAWKIQDMRAILANPVTAGKSDSQLHSIGARGARKPPHHPPSLTMKCHLFI